MDENEIARRLGVAVRDARKKAGLTQDELGAFVGGVDRHKVAAIERGEVSLQVRRLLLMLNTLGLELVVRPATLGQATRASD